MRNILFIAMLMLVSCKRYDAAAAVSASKSGSSSRELTLKLEVDGVMLYEFNNKFNRPCYLTVGGGYSTSGTVYCY